ncbi:MAG: hypothetical protein DVB22_001451 [Verrucomicrobia bacterium]|nr:MAG: hypothetical protein DVB22_001451 [Verrucomicrobiota bacterium]
MADRFGQGGAKENARTIRQTSRGGGCADKKTDFFATGAGLGGVQ